MDGRRLGQRWTVSYDYELTLASGCRGQTTATEANASSSGSWSDVICIHAASMAFFESLLQYSILWYKMVFPHQLAGIGLER